MTRFLHIAILMALACTGALRSLYAEDQVLYWMVDDPDVDCGIYGTMKASEMEESHGSKIDSARVAAFLTEDAAAYADHTIDADDITYLNFYYNNGSGWVLDTTSPIDTIDIVEGKSDSYARASIGNTLGSDYATYSFAIELGTFDANGNWILAAISETKAYEKLTSYIGDELSVPTAMVWNAGGYTAAPEPTSAILMLFGGSLLALRRRRRTEMRETSENGRDAV